MENEFQSMFGDIGFFSKDELLARKRADIKQSNAEAAVEHTRRGDYSMAAVNHINSYFQQKNAQLAPEEQRMLKIRDDVYSEVNKVKDRDPNTWNNMDGFDKALVMRKAQVKAMMSNGMVEQGMALMEQVGQMQMQQEKQMIEQAKLRLGYKSDKLKYRSDGWEYKLAEKGDTANVWIHGETDPNAGFSATIDPLTGDAITKDRRFPVGTYTSIRPLPQREGAAEGEIKLSDVLQKDEIPKLRNTHASLYSQMDTAIALNGLFTKWRENDPQGRLNMMGAAGDIVVFTKELVDNVSALAREFANATNTEFSPVLQVVDQDKKVIGHLTGTEQNASRVLELPQFRSLNEEMDSAYEDQVERTGVREDVINKEVWKSAVVRLAYARAMAREPGARQLSDEDFRRAMNEIAASTTDPEAFRRVMVGGMATDLKTFDFQVGQIPDKYYPKLFGRSMATFEAKRKEFDEVFSVVQPSAGTPTKTTSTSAIVDSMSEDELDAAVNAEMEELMRDLPKDSQ